jgi:hypothetical protein
MFTSVETTYHVEKTPFACPVCKGSTTVSRPPNIPGDLADWTSLELELYDCPACKDSPGVVWG